MGPIAESIKNTVKTVTGRHYEPWIRRPYVVLRSLPRTMLRTMLRIVRTLQRPRLVSASAAHAAQVAVQKYPRKISWRPLLWLLCSPLELLVWILERHYRKYYARFGLAVDNPQKNRNNGKGVLLVSGTLSSGGAERQTILTVLGLSKRHLPLVQLAVVYLRSEAERFYLHKLEAAGMPVIEFDHDAPRNDVEDLGGALGAVDVLPAELHDVAAYMRAIALARPAIVHLWLDEVNVKGGLAAVAAGVPRIILSGRNLPPNNYLLYRPYMREAYRWLLRQPGVTLINNSVAGARAYERWLDLPAGSIRVVHNGFDFDDELLERCRRQRAAYRERRGIPQAVPLVGTVIRFNEEKRPLLWAEIAARVSEALPDAHFLMVGGGVLRKELEARAAQPDLAGRLHLVGLEKQPLEAMAAMDLFLLSSRGEGLPNVLVEAQAVGVPVVTTCVGGAPETLDAGRTGWVLSSDEPDRAAAEIVRLLKDKSWLQAAGRAGPDFVKKNFGLERMLDETLEIYDSSENYLCGQQKEALFGE